MEFLNSQKKVHVPMENSYLFSQECLAQPKVKVASVKQDG